MLTVFLSSTYVDLQPERQALRDAILRLQCQFSGMEYFGSDPERPKDVSLHFLETCNVYVGILAHRYGSIDSETGKSITQIEYERARERGMSTLVYEKDQNSPVEPTSQFIDFDPRYREKLANFREAVRRQCVVQVFANPDELAAKVTADLGKLAIARVRKESEESRSEHDVYSPYAYTVVATGVPNIPMVGPVAVGKTVYGCMLVHEPIAQVAQHGFSVELNERDSHLLEYYRHLSRGEWAPRTCLGQHDFAEFCLRRRKLFGYQEYRIRLLDTSGEDWNRSSDPEFHYGNHGTRWDRVLSGLAGCAGLALFFDVKKRRADHDPLYANILGMLARDQPTGKFPSPVAVILTKCDLLPELLGDVPRATDYLKDEYPLAYAQLQARLRRFSVFPTSSVGEVDGDGKPTNLHPTGLWEPIVWLVRNP